MHKETLHALRAAGLAASIAALAACSAQNATPSITDASTPLSLEARSATKILFVADATANEVRMYPADVQHGAQIGAITSGISFPQGLFVDRGGVLYVANSHAVTEYRPGASTPFRTLSGSLGDQSITVDGGGTVYVGQACQIVPSGGSIAVYAPGSLRPTRTITLNDCSFMGGMTIDRSGNLIVSFFQYPAKIQHVEKFAPGASVGSEITLQGVAEIGGTMTTDRAGNIYADGVSAGGEGVNIYAPGASVPARSITAGMNGPTGIALDGSGKLYVANYPGAVDASFVNVYAPGGSIPVNSFSGDLSALAGLAVRP